MLLTVTSRAIACLLLFSLAAAAQSRVSINPTWLPVTDEERQQNEPLIDKQANIEALFWRVHVADEINQDGLQRALYHYVRLKVFNAAGKEKASSLDIPYDEKTSILNIAARTIKADGTILELKREDIRDMEVLRAGRLKRHVKRLAIPGIEPGVIVEYRWKEIRHNQRGGNIRLYFQREYPVRRVTYFVKPFEGTSDAGLVMSIRPFNCSPSRLKLETNGFNSTFLENMPAFREEPMMPGEPNVRAWALLFYHDGKKREPAKYWEEVGKTSYRQLKLSLKASNEVKEATAKALEGAGQDKVGAIVRYIRKNVRNFYSSRVTDAERVTVLKQMKKDRLRTSAEVLKSGIATPDEMNILFASMANQAGFEARPALTADRNDLVFEPALTEESFLRSVDMAVKAGDDWQLYDVSASRLPSGMLGWNEEGVPVLISDPKKPEFVSSKLSGAALSVVARSAKLRLSADGTLEGDLEETLTGHLASDTRASYDGEPEARHQDILKDQLTRSFPQAEIGNLAVENVAEPESPVKLRYHLKIPGYAQRTGKRLFFQPLFFQRGDPPLFEANERQFDIMFRFAWTETDDISIELPEGFELENAENPGSLNLGKPGSYDLVMSKKDGKLLCKRKLIFGQNGFIAFSRDMYPQVKNVFNEIHKHDNHSLALRAK